MAALSCLLMLTACASTAPETIPPQMLEPEAVQPVSRTDPKGEPYYLSYPVGDIRLEAAFDDGQYTYAEFAQPVPDDLGCFDDSGTQLNCEAVDKVLAIAGVHRGILLRHLEHAVFVAPNPAAQAAPPRQLGRGDAWASHVRARNHVLLKAPLVQALQQSAVHDIDPAINQAAGVRHAMSKTAGAAPATPAASKARASTPRARPKANRATETHSALPWLHVPFKAHSAQLDPQHPQMARLLNEVARADRVLIDVLMAPGAQPETDGQAALLVQARLASLRKLLLAHGVKASTIQVETRQAAQPKRPAAGGSAPAATISIALMKNGAALAMG